jgi:hypothetical protein
MVAKFNSMLFNLTIKSKQKKYIFEFIEQFIVINQKHLRSVKLYFTKKNLNFFFSILTSPHVNKRAQEQFGGELYRLQLRIKTFEPYKLVLILKLVYFRLFPNLRLGVTFKALGGHNKSFILNSNTFNLRKPLNKISIIKISEASGV